MLPLMADSRCSSLPLPELILAMLLLLLLVCGLCPADECRCSLPRDSNLPRGNFNWCCNTPTPRLGINRHIDLSQQAFSAVSKPCPARVCPDVVYSLLTSATTVAVFQPGCVDVFVS
jgi:hypothetical protein